MKFKKEFLKNLIVNENDHAEIVEDVIIDKSIYIHTHRIVFRFNDKFYRNTYSIGVTDHINLIPYQYEDSDEIECEEVISKEKIIITYEPVEVKKRKVNYHMHIILNSQLDDNVS